MKEKTIKTVTLEVERQQAYASKSFARQIKTINVYKIREKIEYGHIKSNGKFIKLYKDNGVYTYLSDIRNIWEVLA